MVGFFPYHSNKFAGGCRVPSQRFAIHQIERAINRRAVIIIVRAKRRLLEAVLSLATYNYVTVNSSASGYVFRRNVPEFRRIVDAINCG